MGRSFIAPLVAFRRPGHKRRVTPAPISPTTPSWMSRALVPLDRLGGAVIALFDLVLPHRCARCTATIADGPGFCTECWRAIDWLDGPACSRCGIPLPVAVECDATCGGCQTQPPPYTRVHAAIAYGTAARTLVLKLKYGRRIGIARLLARLIANRLPADPPDAPAPLIVPVPLSRARLWRRGFNQALLIADRLATLRNGELARDLLRRKGGGESQRGLTRAAREQRMKGAFYLDPRQRERLRGRRVWLVDDVFTSGATARAAARVLRRGGAASVEVVVFARVLDGRGDR